MNDRAAFQATYSDWKLVRSRKVVQVVFEIPLEQANTAFEALGGMPNPGAEIWCAIARLEKPPVPPSPTQAANGQWAIKRAGILCKDPVFWRFLNEGDYFNSEYPIDNETSCAQFIRGFCGVISRSDLTVGSAGAAKLRQLSVDFNIWREGLVE